VKDAKGERENAPALLSLNDMLKSKPDLPVSMGTGIRMQVQTMPVMEQAMHRWLQILKAVETVTGVSPSVFMSNARLRREHQTARRLVLHLLGGELPEDLVVTWTTWASRITHRSWACLPPLQPEDKETIDAAERVLREVRSQWDYTPGLSRRLKAMY